MKETPSSACAGGILLLALAAGFTLASLLVKPPWRSLGDERDKRDEWRSKEAFGGARPSAGGAVLKRWGVKSTKSFWGVPVVLSSLKTQGFQSSRLQCSCSSFKQRDASGLSSISWADGNASG